MSSNEQRYIYRIVKSCTDKDEMSTDIKDKGSGEKAKKVTILFQPLHPLSNVL